MGSQASRLQRQLRSGCRSVVREAPRLFRTREMPKLLEVPETPKLLEAECSSMRSEVREAPKLLEAPEAPKLLEDPKFLPDEFYEKRLPMQVTPGTKYLPKYDEFGNITQIKMYDQHGREIGWIDYTNHGYGDDHTVPHWHEKIYDAQHSNGKKVHHRTDTNTPLGDKK